MIESMTVIIDHSDGALLRVLGTVERRGWQVRGIETAPFGNAALEIRLEIERRQWHAGDAGVLARHLEKLIPVEAVRTAAAAWAVAPIPPHAVAMGA